MDEPLIFVRWHKHVSEANRADVRKQRGMRRVPSEDWDKVGIELYSLPPGLAKKSAEWLVEKGWAEAEVDGEGEGIPIDPSIGEAMSFLDLLAGNTWYQRRIGIPSAWAKSTGKGIKIGVADSGANHEHEWLKGSIVASKNFVANETTVDDREGHGTACAGIVKAVARDASLLVARVMSQNSAKWTAVGASWMWLADQGCIVASTSIGGSSDSFALMSAAAYCLERGCVPICAAGNAGTNTKSYPAATNGCIAVGATDESDNKAGFSQYGDWIDIAAPGVSLLTSYGGGYQSFSGTSGATPIVAGCVAVVAANYRMNGIDALQALMITCRNLGNALYFGAGIPDLLKALEVDAPAPEPEPEPPPLPEPPPPMPTTDQNPPSKPAQPKITEKTPTGFRATWVASQDDVGVVKHRLYLNSVAVRDVDMPGLTWLFTGLVGNKTYVVQVRGVDATGNQGPHSDPLHVSLPVGSTPVPEPPPPELPNLSTSTLSALVVIENDIPSYTRAVDRVELKAKLQRLLGFL